MKLHPIDVPLNSTPITPSESLFNPLTQFVGTWYGNGLDIAPGEEKLVEQPFTEELILEPVPAFSFGSQKVHALRYWGRIFTENAPNFMPVYMENGFILWIPEQQKVIRQVSNPRGLSILASGSFTNDRTLSVASTREDINAGILITSYLDSLLQVRGYTSKLWLEESPSGIELVYEDDTILIGKDGKEFHQMDKARLKRY